MLKHMEVIPYKATGSKYGACGIRIDGSPEFIDAVLSHLKELIDGENHVTRLQLSRQPVDGAKLGKNFDNRTRESEVCYIRLHQRGNEGAIGSSIFNKERNGATERFAQAQQLSF